MLLLCSSYCLSVNGSMVMEGVELVIMGVRGSSHVCGGSVP